MQCCCLPRFQGNMRRRLWPQCHGNRQHCLFPHRHADKRRCRLLRHFGKRHCRLLPHHFGDTQRCCLSRCHSVTWHRCPLHHHRDTRCRLYPAGIRGVVFHPTTLVTGIVIFRHTALGIHNNQPKERRAAKIPATEAKQLATTSRRDEMTRGWRNTNASATTSTR